MSNNPFYQRVNYEKKCTYAVEFLAALLRNDQDYTSVIKTIIEEAIREKPDGECGLPFVTVEEKADEESGWHE